MSDQLQEDFTECEAHFRRVISQYLGKPISKNQIKLGKKARALASLFFAAPSGEDGIDPVVFVESEFRSIVVAVCETLPPETDYRAVQETVMDMCIPQIRGAHMEWQQSEAVRLAIVSEGEGASAHEEDPPKEFSLISGTNPNPQGSGEVLPIEAEADSTELVFGPVSEGIGKLAKFWKEAHPHPDSGLVKPDGADDRVNAHLALMQSDEARQATCEFFLQTAKDTMESANWKYFEVSNGHPSSRFARLFDEILKYYEDFGGDRDVSNPLWLQAIEARRKWEEAQATSSKVSKVEPPLPAGGATSAPAGSEAAPVFDVNVSSKAWKGAFQRHSMWNGKPPFGGSEIVQAVEKDFIAAGEQEALGALVFSTLMSFAAGCNSRDKALKLGFYEEVQARYLRVCPVLSASQIEDLGRAWQNAGVAKDQKVASPLVAGTNTEVQRKAEGRSTVSESTTADHLEDADEVDKPVISRKAPPERKLPDWRREDVPVSMKPLLIVGLVALLGMIGILTWITWRPMFWVMVAVAVIVALAYLMIAADKVATKVRTWLSDGAKIGFGALVMYGAWYIGLFGPAVKQEQDVKPQAVVAQVAQKDDEGYEDAIPSKKEVAKAMAEVQPTKTEAEAEKEVVKVDVKVAPPVEVTKTETPAIAEPSAVSVAKAGDIEIEVEMEEPVKAVAKAEVAPIAEPTKTIAKTTVKVGPVIAAEAEKPMAAPAPQPVEEVVEAPVPETKAVAKAEVAPIAEPTKTIAKEAVKVVAESEKPMAAPVPQPVEEVVEAPVPPVVVAAQPRPTIAIAPDKPAEEVSDLLASVIGPRTEQSEMAFLSWLWKDKKTAPSTENMKEYRAFQAWYSNNSKSVVVDAKATSTRRVELLKLVHLKESDGGLVLAIYDSPAHAKSLQDKRDLLKATAATNK